MKLKKTTILDTQAAKIVRTLNEDNFRKMKILFNTTHALNDRIQRQVKIDLSK